MDYFIINNKYYLLSETRYHDDNSPRYIQLYFGGNKVQCINIDIPGRDSSIGFFYTVVFDKWCNIDKNLTNGKPLRVLINTALNYVKIKYPYIKQLKLDDMSNRVCAYGEKLAVSLFHFHIVFSGGQTWYEKYFGATKLDKHFWDKYQNSIEKLKSADFKKTLQPPKIINSKIDYIGIFNTSATLLDFFNNLKNEFIGSGLTIKDLCIYTSGWLEQYLNNFVFPKDTNLRYDWFIDLETIKLIPITIFTEIVEPIELKMNDMLNLEKSLKQTNLIGDSIYTKMYVRDPTTGIYTLEGLR